MDKDKVKNFLDSMGVEPLENYVPKTSANPDKNECDQCTMSETMHTKYPKNTCGRFIKIGTLASKDGEARKDGWTE